MVAAINRVGPTYCYKTPTTNGHQDNSKDEAEGAYTQSVCHKYFDGPHTSRHTGKGKQALERTSQQTSPLSTSSSGYFCMLCAQCGILLAVSVVPSERRQDFMDMIDAFVLD